MTDFYNGELKCNTGDAGKVLCLLRDIFNNPKTTVDVDLTVIRISNDKQTDITTKIGQFCEALKKKGIYVTGEIFYVGDCSGKLLLSGLL